MSAIALTSSSRRMTFDGSPSHVLKTRYGCEYNDINIIFGIILNVLIVYLVLKSSNWLEQKLGDGTLMVLQKVFGIILLAISIKLFTANFAQLFQTYVHF